MHPWSSRSVGLKRASWIIILSLLQSPVSPYNLGSVTAVRKPAAVTYVQVKLLSICFLLRENLMLKWLSKGRKHSCFHHHLWRHGIKKPASFPLKLWFLLDTFWMAAIIHFAAGMLVPTAPPLLLWPPPHLSLALGARETRLFLSQASVFLISSCVRPI